MSEETTDEELDSKQKICLCFALVAPGGVSKQQQATDITQILLALMLCTIGVTTFDRTAGQALHLSEAQAHLPYATLPQNDICTPQGYKPACCSTETT